MRTMNRPAAIPALKARAMVGAAAITAMILFGAASANGQGLPPLAKELNPAQTALILVDFQYPFTSPDGANYRNVKKEMDEKRLLDRTVELVGKARSLMTPVLGATHAAELIDRVLKLEDTKNILELRPLLQRKQAAGLPTRSDWPMA